METRGGNINARGNETLDIGPGHLHAEIPSNTIIVCDDHPIPTCYCAGDYCVLSPSLSVSQSKQCWMRAVGSSWTIQSTTAIYMNPPNVCGTCVTSAQTNAGSTGGICIILAAGRWKGSPNTPLPSVIECGQDMSRSSLGVG